jgi:integration host factor subunit alpha
MSGSRKKQPNTKTLTKIEIAKALHDKSGISLKETPKIVNAFFETIVETLESGEAVKLSGFGNFSLRDKPSRMGRNPKTGKTAQITARRVITFYPSDKLKDAVDFDEEK